MSLPVEMFPLLSPSQISPVMTGISQANQLYAQSMQNQYLQQNLQAGLRKQQLANNISQAQANVAPQMNAAQLAYNQAKTPNLNAATQYLLSGQLPEAQAQAGYIGTMGAKNQFQLNNPATMLPGFAGQIGGLDTIRNMGLLNNGQSPNVAPPTQNSNFVNGMNNGVPMRVPGIPSAGNIAPGGQNGQIMPPNPYGAMPQNGQAQQDIAQGNNPGLMNYQDAQNLLLKGMTAPIEKNIAQADYYNSRANLSEQQSQAFAFNALPQNTKTYMIGQAQGMGVPAQQAIKAYMSGETISTLAQKMGYDPNNLPAPIISPTPQSLNQISVRRQARAELGVMQPFVTSALAPYSSQFNSYSPKQMWDAMSNDNPQQQMNTLAAIQLSPELISTRARSMGVNIGIETLREMSDKSQMNMKALQAFVTPQVFSGAQKIAESYINKGGNAANTVGLAGSLGNTGGVNPSVAYQPGAVPQTPSNPSSLAQNSSAQNNSMVVMKAPNGEMFHIPSSKVAAALKMGAVQQ